MTEPKLFTPEQAARFSEITDCETVLAELRERGLIVPEPVSEPTTIAQRLTQAFARHLAGKAAVFHLNESPWASITFNGTRHVFSVEPLWGVSFDDLDRAVEDWQPTISGRLLADIALSSQPDGLRAVLLLLEDAS